MFLALKEWISASKASREVLLIVPAFPALAKKASWQLANFS
jgi:hypothetical protein